MRLFISILFLLLLINGYSQFEYSPIDFDENNMVYNCFSYKDKIYNIDRDNILREIDESSSEIIEYSIYTGFPIRGNTKSYLIDSFLVILNGERAFLDYSGVLIFNMNSKAQKFYSWAGYLEEFAGSASELLIPGLGLIYTPAPVSISLNDQYINSDRKNLYIIRHSYIDTMPILLKINPVEGLEKIELSGLANTLETSEWIKSFGSSESIMVVYTSLDRIIFWEINNPSIVKIGAYNLGATPYFFSAKGHVFPFSNSDNVLGTIDTTGMLNNFSLDFQLPEKSAGGRFFIGDSLCLSYQTDNLLIIIDTTESIKTVHNISNLNIPSSIYGLAPHSDKKSLLLKMNLRPLSEEYQPELYKYRTDGTISPIQTTPLKNFRDFYQSYGRVNNNNELFLIGHNSYAIHSQGKFKQYLLQHDELKGTSENASINRYFHGEDKDGNIYGTVTYNYDNSLNHLDTSYYLRVDGETYEYSIILKADFDSVLLNKGIDFENGLYIVQEGGLKFVPHNSTNEQYYSVYEDSIEKVFTINQKIFASSFNTIYQLDDETNSFQKIQTFNTEYSLFQPSHDIMGNIYIYAYPQHVGAKLYKMAFNDTIFKEVSPPNNDSIGSGRLMHNWYGDVYIERTYRSYSSSHEINNNFTFFNGFEWDERNSLISNLPYEGSSYRLMTSPSTTRIILERTSGRYVDVICPTPGLNDIKSVYYIRDSALPAEVSLNSDIVKAMWSTSNFGLSNKIYEPGRHWVKVLYENGCSDVKEFEVKMLPTQSNENSDIFYNFSNNAFPLIFSSDEKGDLVIYDTKGSKVKTFINYQNNWIPDEGFQNSIMVYAIYKDGHKIKSGRILFL